MTKSRKKFDAAFKAKVALGSASGGFDGSGAGQAARGAPVLRLEEAGGGQYGEPVSHGGAEACRGGGRGGAPSGETAKLYSKIGETDGIERDFLGQEAKSMSAPARNARRSSESGAELVGGGGNARC